MRRGVVQVFRFLRYVLSVTNEAFVVNSEAMMVSEVQVRDARVGDAKAITALWRELMELHCRLDSRFVVSVEGEREYLRHVVRMIRTRDARVLVSEELGSGRLVGYVVGEMQFRPYGGVSGRYGFIADIYVRESFRKRGIGREMVKTLQVWFVARKAVAIELYVSVVNADSQAFWRSLGMEPFLCLMHRDL